MRNPPQCLAFTKKGVGGFHQHKFATAHVAPIGSRQEEFFVATCGEACVVVESVPVAAVAWLDDCTDTLKTTMPWPYGKYLASFYEFVAPRNISHEIGA